MAQKARSVICIGDIHGHIQKLNNLWLNLQAALDPSEFSSALVIFLGDYCDRGPHTRQVIDFFISLPERHPDQTHVFLAGNHDFAFAAFLGLIDGSNFEKTWKEYAESEKREGWYKDEGFENMHYQGRRWGGIIDAQADSAFGVVYIGSIYDAGSTFQSYGVPHGSIDLKEVVPTSHKKFLTEMVWVHEEVNAKKNHKTLNFGLIDQCVLQTIRNSRLMAQNEVYVETKNRLEKRKLIAVHAGLENGISVNKQLELLRAKDASIARIQPLSGRENVLAIPEELADKQTIIVSGHHGTFHIDGLRFIIDESGGYSDRPLTAIVLPSKKIIRDTIDTDIFPN